MPFAHSHVVSFSDSSHLQQQTSVGNVCRRLCVCVCVLYTLHQEARGLRWNHGATATTHCPPFAAPRPLWPFAPRLAGSPASERHTDTHTHSHRLCKPLLHQSQHTHTQKHKASPPPPPPPALGRSIQLFAFHLTRALEELRFLKKTQYSTPSQGSLFFMCEASLHVHAFVNENVWGRAAEKERIHVHQLKL
ncbi:hypothetical protein ILYODFUR_030712 [Ilyodon furcidens]|uniref:Uncharacterized protein n=1 Tax=Ilyodon furcidens TaxID=33524 RepID=A0ABV0UXS5_9TELE